MSRQSSDQDQINELEIRLKQKQMDYDAARREALGANDTCKRQVEQINKISHEKHLYEIENSHLIK